jgi:hypothetical protein
MIPALTHGFPHRHTEVWRGVSMANDQSRRWEQQLREAAVRVEEELRRVVTYINDEVVPEIRENGSQALRVAAAELQKLAQHIDDHRAATPPQSPTQDKDKPQT